MAGYSIEQKTDTMLKIVLSSDFENLERLVDTIQEFTNAHSVSEDMRDRVLVAVSEASTNAMRHGNRFAPDKSVTVELVRRGGEISVEVQDEGEGFVREAVANPLLPENLFKTSGRGLFLIEELADGVHFEDGGRRVHMVFHEGADDG